MSSTLHADHTAGVERGPGDPHRGLSVHRSSAASPEASALHGLRSPEEERKQDAYQERLFLFFVTYPHSGLGRAICRAGPGLAAAACCPQLWVLQAALHPTVCCLCSAPGLALEHHRISGLLAAQWGKTSYLPLQEVDVVFLAVGFASLFLDS